MNRSVFKFPSPKEPMNFDGERYTSGISGPIQREHYHRYLFSLRYCANKEVLDVACGEGYGSYLLGQVATNVVGVDIDQETVDFANKNYISERVSFRRGNAIKLPIADQSVDVVISFETIEHFADQNEFLSEISRVLRPDGLVIMSSPNREIYSEANNYQNPYHVHEMNKSEFLELVSQHFQHIEILEQGSVLGSAIMRQSELPTDGLEGFTTVDGQRFERLTGVPCAPYFIAVAGRSPFVSPPNSILSADFYQEEADRRIAAIENIRQEQAFQLSGYKIEVTAAEMSLRAEISSLQEQIKSFTERERGLTECHGNELAELKASMLSKLLDFLKYGFHNLFTTKQKITDPSNVGTKQRERSGMGSFDPQYYLDRYPDLKAANVRPREHFVRYGISEGRRGKPVADELTWPPLQDDRQPVIVICHDASRTGAPILGWNLIRSLREKHPIVTLLMHGGVLEKNFAEDSDVVVGPLKYEDWHAVEFAHIAERLVHTYRPLYAVANSIESSRIVPPLATLGVPVVALVHEFASYTRPLECMRLSYDWASHIVFPAELVAKSSYDSFPGLAERCGIHILAQGRQLLPELSAEDRRIDEPHIGGTIRAKTDREKFIVLGAGSVHIRKGVDLFLSVAAAARRLAPDINFKFVWVGEGYDPAKDTSYSVYLEEQIKKSNLKDVVEFVEPVTDFEPAYFASDVFLLSSRLDPQPNVGIDALTFGLPVVCFEGACGTGEILVRDSKTKFLVVPHLDVEAAAEVICRLANEPKLLKVTKRAVEQVARREFNAETYIEEIDAWGLEATKSISALDLETLRISAIVDAETALPVSQLYLPRSASAEGVVLLQSAIVGLSQNQHGNAFFRRPTPGFHPQVYAAEHLDICGPGGENPTAHWLRHGRPSGAWLRRVYSPIDPPVGPFEKVRVALHAHFYYPDLAPDLAIRLKENHTRCDLFISTDTDSKAESLRRAFEKHQGNVIVRILPNCGRDIGPLLTGFNDEIVSGEYDVWGHVHGKRSLWSGAGFGDAWRNFLWENLIGDNNCSMLDMAVSAFASDPKLGLIFAEDPHLVGWDGNRKIAADLAKKMRIPVDFPDFFDFPLGAMFWFRPAALTKLLALKLKWTDYPKEPVPYDGSLLHAIERIIPLVVKDSSFGIASLRAPHSNW